MPARRCSGGETHELVFVVKQKNLEKLEALASDLTDPASPNYRKWLSGQEVRDLTRNDDSLLALKEVLRGHPEVELLHEAVGGEFVRAHAPVATWEQFLSTDFHVWEHPDNDGSIIRASEYALPQTLASHVVGVLNAIDFDFDAVIPHYTPGVDKELEDVKQGLRPEFGHSSFDGLKEATGEAVVSPTKLRKIYNMPPIHPRGSELAKQESNVTQVVFATLSQHWSPSDRTVFEAHFGIPQDQYVRQLKGEEEGNSMSGDLVCKHQPQKCAEANLDVQYMMAMAPWAQTGYWYIPKATSSGMTGFLLDFVQRFVGAKDAPDVISISYGMPEHFVSRTALVMFDVQSMKLAAQGVTLLAASGDDGAASFLARKVLHGMECWSVPMFGLQATWPASSRWVTGVGATVGSAIGEPDVVCSSNATGPSAEGSTILITSGGGYSQDWKRPSWQDGHVEDRGRGVPDLSLIGHSYSIVIGGRWLAVDGTSAAAPTLGGMVSSINADLKAAGKPSVGFLNPLLYRNSNSSSSMFFDVTEGDNRCAARGAPCCGGYDAAPGWDAASGLGVPDFAKLRAAILASSA